MRYTVVWTSRAKNEFSEIWINAPVQASIKDSVEMLEIRLSNNPMAVGEPRAEGARLVVDAPLQLMFEVIEAERVVVVTRVARVRR